MGEAKRRKQEDPNYGKPRTDTLRGLIISTPTKVSGSTVLLGSTRLNPEELRTSLLYWDRLSMPTNSAIYIQPEPDAQFLIDSGILYTPNFNPSGDVSQALSVLPSLALMEYEKSNPGMWSLGGGENSVLVANGFSISDAGTSLRLYNAIPAPAADVPLAEILQFRQKRREELLAFRTHIELLTKEIESSTDSEAELNRKLSDLDKACSNLALVCREWQYPVYLTNFKASINFNLAKASSAAIGTWMTTGQLGLPETARAISSGLAAFSSILDLKSDINFQKIKRPSSPFKYVYEAQKILIS